MLSSKTMISPIDLKLIKKIDEILAEFARFLTRPEQKFVREFIFGILSSKRALISEVARHLPSDLDVRYVYKRLERNLGTYSFDQPYRLAQAKMLRHIDEDYLLIFDPSEVVKPFGKKMEGLTKVRDASAKPRFTKSANGKTVRVPELTPGYPLTIAIAVSPDGEILPVELSLFAFGGEDFLSQNDESIKAIDTLVQRTLFKPLLVLDREFDAFSYFRHFMGLNQRFLIRLKENRKYRLPGAVASPKTPTYTRDEMLEKFCFLRAKKEIRYTYEGVVEENEFEFEASHVAVIAESGTKDQIRKEGDTCALTLIKMKIKKDYGIPTLYLLTNAKPETPEDLIYLGRSYLARWNVEEYIRFLKQHFSLEEFLVRDLGRIKNLVHAVYIATVIIHLLTRRKTKFGFTSHYHLLKNSRPVSKVKESRDFFLYSYGMGLAHVMEMNKKLLSPKKKIRKEKTDENQYVGD